MVAFLHMSDLVALGHDHTGRLMPQQGGRDGRRAAVRSLGRAMDLVQLGVTDPAGKEFDQYLIRLRIGEGDVIDDQGRIRFNEDGGFGARRHGVPLLERHVATAIAVARFLKYSSTRSARYPAQYERCHHLVQARYLLVPGFKRTLLSARGHPVPGHGIFPG